MRKILGKMDLKTKVLAALVILLSIASTWAGTGVVLALRNFLNGDSNEIYLVIALLLVTVAIDPVQVAVAKAATFRVYNSMYGQFVAAMLECDYRVYTSHDPSHFQHRLGDLSEISPNLFQMANSLISIGVILIRILELAPLLVFPVVGLLALGFIGIAALGKPFGRNAAELDGLSDKRLLEVSKILGGAFSVRINSTENIHRKALLELNTGIIELQKKKGRMLSGFVISFNILNGVLTLLVAIYVIMSGLDPATALTLVAYVEQLGNPFNDVVNNRDLVSSVETSINKYDALIKEMRNIQINDGTLNLDTIGDIRLDNVRFSYGNTGSVLNGLTLHIKKGQTVGICGPSGGGKSTLLNLLLRLYDVTGGTISVGGVDIRELTLSSLRKKFGVVQQTPFIFPGTIRENLLYGTSGRTEVEMVEAVKAANIYDFIRGLPDGFDTDVGPNGIKLSGGQKQRLALAALFLKDPDVVLLDEATSALDNESEKIIKESLRLFSGKTIIMIAHRLSTIQKCDTIVVLKDGKVAEQGAHKELLDHQGEYYSLVMAATEE